MNSYSRLRVKCLGRECIGYRTGGELPPDACDGVCAWCCNQWFPHIKRTILHPVDDINAMICRRCWQEFPIAQRCDCCVKSTRDAACCKVELHKCCKRPRIIFVNSDLEFAYPKREDKASTVGWVDRDSSSYILTRSAPISEFNIDPKGFAFNNSRRFAAVEVEIFNYNDATKLNEIVDKWKCSIVHDGSMLRNADVAIPVDNTFEINSSPACGDALKAEIAELAAGLKAAEASVGISCGLHVHGDCRDFGYQEIQRLVRIYKYIEEALFASVHWTRYNNEFCGHCGDKYFDKFVKGIKPDTKALKHSFFEEVYGAGATDPVYAKQAGQPRFYQVREDHYGRLRGNRNPVRYAALNLHTYFLRGTVEFRLHHGSVDFNEIYGWAKLIVDLLDGVYKSTDTQLERILAVKPTEILETEELLNIKNFKRLVNTTKVAEGMVVMRSLVPEESYQHLLDKIKLACINPVLASSNVLPCHLADYKESKKEKVQEVAPQAPAIMPNYDLYDRVVLRVPPIRPRRRR